MSRVTYNAIDKTAGVRGPERAYAGLVVSKLTEGFIGTSASPFGDNAEFCLQLNTAIFVGNDAVRLLARLHGQCEIHGYIEGPNRGWYAGIIHDGLEAGVLRAEMGWESVMLLLSVADDSPIVTDYSVTESFPSQSAASWAGYEEPREGAWYEDLTEAERWELAVKGVRSSAGCEWKPEMWAHPNFGDGKTALDRWNSS